MTFSIIARCPDTKALGICIATSAFAVSSRCTHLRGGVAVIASQNHSNWRLGLIGLDLAENGLAPDQILTTLRSYDPNFDYRQVGIVTIDGKVGAHSGPKGHAFNGHRLGDGFVALGNGVASERVIQEMAKSFEANVSESFEERLMQAIEAGCSAGGETIGHLSAALMVAVPGCARPRVDLRVDLASRMPEEGGDAVEDLRRVFDRYRPLIDYYGDYWHDNPEVTAQEWIDRAA